MGFRGENFHCLLTRTTYCPLSLQTITEKTFADRHKTAKFVKLFSLESFPLHGSCWQINNCESPLLYTEYFSAVKALCGHTPRQANTSFFDAFLKCNVEKAISGLVLCIVYTFYNSKNYYLLLLLSKKMLENISTLNTK